MGDQQERSDLAFAAGLITGEGTFTIGLLRTGKNARATPIFSITMKDRATMLYLYDILLDNGLSAHFSQKKKELFHIKATGLKRVQKYCEIFLPYLVGGKKKSAELVLEFIESRLSKPPNSGFTAYEIDLVDQLRKHHGSRHPNILPISEILRDYTPGTYTRNKS